MLTEMSDFVKTAVSTAEEAVPVDSRLLRIDSDPADSFARNNHAGLTAEKFQQYCDPLATFQFFFEYGLEPAEPILLRARDLGQLARREADNFNHEEAQD